MSAPASTPVAQPQADALIDEIARQVAAQRQAILDAAEREAGEIRSRAREKARRQMRRAIADLRAAERQRTRQVRAELETRARHHASARALDLLAVAWPALDAAIARRWRDATARARWLDAQLALAQARLPRAAWVLRHPAGWADAERDALHALLAARGVTGATLEADPSVQVGLVIEADGVRLDSVPQALVVDRGFVEAALLAALPPDHG